MRHHSASGGPRPQAVGIYSAAPRGRAMPDANLVDLVRESTNVTRPVSVAEVIDFSFLEKAQKQLGLK